MGGGKNYAEAYSKYQPAAKFTSYVDKYPDLKAAWKRIEDDPDHPDSQYWIKRGATSKEAFGRAHAAEDAALKGGTYMGATKYTPGSEALKGLLGDEGNTRYEQFLAGSSSDSGDDGPGPRSGGGSPGDRNYPMNILDYTPPSQIEGIPLEFQPWIQPDHISDDIWSYKPPTLEEWDVTDRVKWDWATKPASEHDPAAKAAAQSGLLGDQGSEGFTYDKYGYEIDPRTGKRTGNKINDSLGIGNKILSLMGADSAEIQRAKAFAKEAGVDPDTVGMGVAPSISEIGMTPS